MSIVIRVHWTQRRKLRTLAQRSKDRDLARRAMAIGWIMNAKSVSEVADSVAAARSTLYRWIGWFEGEGIAGLVRDRGGRAPSTVTGELLEALQALVEDAPQTYGYLRSSWSSELLSVALWEHHGLSIHPATVRSVLKRQGVAWRRARPTLYKRDPRKQQKLEAIQRAIASANAPTEVFFVDEADIDLNPPIGFVWSRRGQQHAVATPGQNEKHYVAGALNARTGRLVWVEHPHKNTTLFMSLLHAIRRRYRRAKRIVLVLDNYIVHKADAVNAWLANNPKFTLLFQPVYYPWINRLERLWKAMHDTVTRNHRCFTLYQLCQLIKRFFEVAQPFPGAGHGVARFRAGI